MDGVPDLRDQMSFEFLLEIKEWKCNKQTHLSTSK